MLPSGQVHNDPGQVQGGRSGLVGVACRPGRPRRGTRPGRRADGPHVCNVMQEVYQGVCSVHRRPRHGICAVHHSDDATFHLRRQGGCGGQGGGGAQGDAVGRGVAGQDALQPRKHQRTHCSPKTVPRHQHRHARRGAGCLPHRWRHAARNCGSCRVNASVYPPSPLKRNDVGCGIHHEVIPPRGAPHRHNEGPTLLAHPHPMPGHPWGGGHSPHKALVGGAVGVQRVARRSRLQTPAQQRRLCVRGNALHAGGVWNGPGVVVAHQVFDGLPHRKGGPPGMPAHPPHDEPHPPTPHPHSGDTHAGCVPRPPRCRAHAAACTR